jgi:ribonuclease P/MRP protein subunit RPP40
MTMVSLKMTFSFLKLVLLLTIGHYKKAMKVLFSISPFDSLEKNNHTKPHLMEQFSPNQHGFMENRSCTTNLLSFWNEVSNNIDKKHPVDVVYFDYSKAFDTVPHQRLIKKLGVYGIQGKLQNWIGCWLTERTQRVVLNGSRSRTHSVQGSVLGPTLFSLFIDDLNDCVDCKIFMFADDTKLVQKVTNPHQQENLQKNINSMADWSDKWGLSFNSKKCSVLHMGPKNPNYKYTLKGDNISAPSTQRDLGVLIQKDGKFDQHITNTVFKCNRLANMIKQNFKTNDLDIYSRLYKTYLVPIATFCSEMWSPVYKYQIEMLETILKNLLKYKLVGTNHLEKLKMANPNTMQHTRQAKDLKLMQEMLMGRSSLIFSDFFTHSVVYWYIPVMYAT